MPNVDADPAALLTHLAERSGVLREPVPGRVDFVHRTFQEYLAAEEAIQQHHVQTLTGHAHLDTWWETFVMACGHATAKQAAQLLTEILDRSDKESAHARHLRLLAAACLETVQDIDPTVRARTDAMIKQRLVPPRNRRETGSLAAIGHRVLRYLPDTLGGLSDARAAATVRAAALTGSAEALPIMARYAQDPRSTVQRELERAWQYFDPQRFAETVLADSPLRNGAFTIYSRRFLPYVSHLRALTSLSVRLPRHERVNDLRSVTGLPALTELRVFCSRDQRVNLAPLGEHNGLRWLRIWSAKQFTGLGTLGAMDRLTHLGLYPMDPWHRIAFLTHTPRLEFLDLGSIERVDNLAPIGDLSALRSLYLEGHSDQALMSLDPMDRVTQLDLFDPKGEGDLSIVAATFPCVVEMNLAGFGEIDLAPLAALPLSSLTLQSSGCADLEPLTRIPGLRQLRLNYVKTDLSPLANLKLRLTLDRGHRYAGLDTLGPGVKISYRG
jgi:hypothetical protein